LSGNRAIMRGREISCHESAFPWPTAARQVYFRLKPPSVGPSLQIGYGSLGLKKAPYPTAVDCD
jgi:hypothetical protein